jgi:uncharacterized membrane protein
LSQVKLGSIRSGYRTSTTEECPLTALATALAIFILFHSVPAVPSIRQLLVGTLGRRPYLLLYSLISITLLVWVFAAALAMEHVALWETAAWQAWLPLLLSPVALWLLLAGLASSNPLSISLLGDGQPGAITSITRHPVLWGFLLWSASHIPPNGDLRALVLFGGLAAFSAFGIWTSERRARKRHGARWAKMAEATSIVPLVAVLVGRTGLTIDGPMLAAAAAAALLTIWLLLGGHAVLFGADPLALLG